VVEEGTSGVAFAEATGKKACFGGRLVGHNLSSSEFRAFRGSQMES